jgi:hypothetical protein
MGDFYTKKNRFQQKEFLASLQKEETAEEKNAYLNNKYGSLNQPG